MSDSRCEICVHLLIFESDCQSVPQDPTLNRLQGKLIAGGKESPTDWGFQEGHGKDVRLSDNVTLKSVGRSSSNLHTPSLMAFKERTLTCGAISPASRLLGTFQSVPNLLCADSHHTKNASFGCWVELWQPCRYQESRDSPAL